MVTRSLDRCLIRNHTLGKYRFCFSSCTLIFITCGKSLIRLILQFLWLNFSLFHKLILVSLRKQATLLLFYVNRILNFILGWSSWLFGECIEKLRNIKRYSGVIKVQLFYTSIILLYVTFQILHASDSRKIDSFFFFGFTETMIHCETATFTVVIEHALFESGTRKWFYLFIRLNSLQMFSFNIVCLPALLIIVSNVKHN